MNLYELQDKENLSGRSFKVCLTNKLQSLDAIKAYYSQYRTFLNLRHCGAKSNLELIDLCRKNLDKEEHELGVSDEKPLSLYELRDEENLSVRSFNVCQAYNLQDLDAIKSYYSQHKTFLNLSNCGKKSNLELLDICFKYQNRVDNSEAPKRQNPFRIKIDDPFLSKYEQNLKWSKSTVEICKANKLSNLGLVLNHFEEKQTFGTLENIENNTVSELEAICKAFDQKTVGFKFWQSEIPEKEGLKSIERRTNRYQVSIAKVKRELIATFIQIGLDNLSALNRQALTAYLNGNFSNTNFKKLFVDPASVLREIKKTFIVNEKELTSYFSSVKRFIKSLKAIENREEANRLKNQLCIAKRFKNIGIKKNAVRSDRIFRTIYYLINQNFLFNYQDCTIFRRYFKLFETRNPLQVENLSRSANISKESVNSSIENCISQLDAEFSFVEELVDGFLDELFHHKSYPVIIIDSDITDRINQKNNTRFSTQFITYVLGRKNAAAYTIVGDIRDAFKTRQKRTDKHHLWKSLYLVRHDIARAINVINLINALDDKIKNMGDGYSLNLHQEIIPFFEGEPNFVMERVEAYIAEIILLEFDSILIENGKISGKKNHVRFNSSYAKEALEAIGKPASIHEIAEKVIELNPGKSKTNIQIRRVLNDNEEFIRVGTYGVYGLKVWDIKDSPIDMLPIKEIATEILDLHSEPVHLNEVTEYVKQFWPKSTKFSIRSALKRYPYSFRIFEDDYVGSYSKKYSKTFVPISKNIEQNWGKQMQSVRIFIKRNNRLPYDTKKSKKESELYLWWKSQYDAMIHKDLSESKMKKIEAIALKYGKNSKS